MVVENVNEERPCDGGHHVGVDEGDEMCILGEMIDHHEDDAFTMHLG